MRRTSDPASMLVAAIAAAALPSLLAFNVAPSPTFLNQALAFIGWGVFAWLVFRDPGASVPGPSSRRRAAPGLLALALVAAAAAWSWLGGALPASLAVSAIGTLGAAMVLFAAGLAVSSGRGAQSIFGAFCLAWVVAGVLNAGIAAVQVFAPTWPDGDWIARSSIPGRAVGNLRQPNHLSSLLMWAAIGVIAALELRRLRLRPAIVMFALLVLAVVLTASRTGVLGVVLLALWGLVDSRLQRASRRLLWAAPVVYLLGWLAMSAWSGLTHAEFGGRQRLAEPDLSSSRFAIWADTWTLIRAHPLTGVGFGEFNFAWSLSEMPHRPVAFFDHSHNIVLQLAVELGVPLAALVIGLLLWGVVRALGTVQRIPGDASIPLRCALAMLALIGVHSLLEYPLWYSYFLLPTAWLFGVAAREAGNDEAIAAARANGAAAARAAATALSAMVVVGALAAVADYARVVAIFSPAQSASPLRARIDEGRRSVLFAHHANYAAATVTDAPSHEMAAFDSASRYLLDTRLMVAWTKAFAVAGDLARARHLAQRLREFRNPQSAAFLEACAQPSDAASAPPTFHCAKPTETMDWRAFLPP